MAMARSSSSSWATRLLFAAFLPLRRQEQRRNLVAVRAVDGVAAGDPAEVGYAASRRNVRCQILDEWFHRGLERIVDTVEEIEDVVDAELIQRLLHGARDGVIAEVLGQVVGEGVEVPDRRVVDVFDLVDEVVDQFPEVKLSIHSREKTATPG